MKEICSNCFFAGPITSENVQDANAFLSGAMELDSTEGGEFADLYVLLRASATDLTISGSMGRSAQDGENLRCNHSRRVGIRTMKPDTPYLVILEHDKFGKPVYGFKPKV